jgi:hypothetical protein
LFSSLQMAMTRENYKQVSQALEQARSLDFEVRNTPGQLSCFWLSASQHCFCC